MPAVIQPVISNMHTGQWTMQMGVTVHCPLSIKYIFSISLHQFYSHTHWVLPNYANQSQEQGSDKISFFVVQFSQIRVGELFCGGREGGNQFQSRPARCTSSLYGNTNPDITLTPAKHVNSESRRLPIVQFGTETKYWARATNIQ